MHIVSIGVPVRNGASMLRDALDSLVAQTYPTLDIILSDNASTDSTSDICREYVARDSRFRYVRHDHTLTALENFRYCFDQGCGPYWMWAAHDDLRSANYVEALVQGAAEHPDASLLFTDTGLFTDRETRAPVAELRPEDTEPRVRARTNLAAWHYAIARAHYRGSGTQIYGLLRRDALRGYRWSTPPIAPDIPLIHYLATQGELRYVPGARFLYYRSPNSEAAQYMSKQAFWDFDRMVAETANIVVDAVLPGASLRVRTRAAADVFVAVGTALHGGASGWSWHYLSHVYGFLPESTRQRWRAAKRLLHRSAAQ